MPTRFCSICGRSENEVRLVGNICVECFTRIYGLVAVPRLRPVPRCRSCGSILVGGRWIEARDFEEAVRIVVESMLPRLLKPSRREVSGPRIKSYRVLRGPSWTTLLELEVEASLGDTVASERKVLELRFKPTLCPRCRTYRSGEYSVVVQIRGKSVEKVLEEALGLLGDRASRIIEVIPMHGGYDVYFDEPGAARRLARILSSLRNARMLETGEIVGTNRSGRRRLRKTIVVRLE